MTQTSEQSHASQRLARELDLPETTYVSDIENRVLQSLVVQTLSTISGIGLIEGTFIDDLLNRGRLEGVKGIFVEQNSAQHTVSIRIDLNVAYGIVIPEKAEEIQSKVSQAITQFTGLHVASVHVVFKNLIPQSTPKDSVHSPYNVKHSEEDFGD